jgi:hypothetical protein
MSRAPQEGSGALLHTVLMHEGINMGLVLFGTTFSPWYYYSLLQNAKV